MDNRIFISHISETGKIQTTEEHLRDVALYASKALKPIRLENSAYFVGLIHDFGKYTDDFNEYIKKSANGEHTVKGSVNHTFAGVRWVLNKYHSGDDKYIKLAAELLAYSAGAHHGLFDCIDENHNSGFLHRLTKSGIKYEQAKENYFHCACDEAELDTLFSRSLSELKEKIADLINFAEESGDEDGSELYFYFSLLTRVFLSAVIEGDRRDTAEFMKGSKNEYVQADEKLWADCLERTEKKLSAFKAYKPIHFARREISDICKNAADGESGIYRLNVPTGGGKTLSSLRFALTHAKNHKKSRIIFTSPLLSILEQNADVLREYIGDDSIVLEHHSNIVNEKNGDDDLDKYELLSESWDSPVIITTLVQLLNTLFSGKTSSIRRFNKLCNSVIVIDEVQTVPSNMLSLFDLALNFLVKVCNTTVVLCSATQPCFESATHPIRLKATDIVPFDKRLWQIFKRTEIVSKGAMDLEEIPIFAAEILEEKDSLLIVCNKKQEAEFIFNTLSLGAFDCFHLSASMCPQHRRNTVKEIQKSLDDKSRKTVCVSTQVIEAGVDISFACAIRLSAGLDNIVQTAGRCNRNGESESPMPVYIVRCNGENLDSLKEIKRAKGATLDLLEEFRKYPEKYDYDLSGNEAVNRYYKILFKKMGDGQYQDFYIKELSCSIYNMLSFNYKFVNEKADEYGFALRQAFKTAGKKFKVFDENTKTVIVPYGEGEQILCDIMSEKARYNLEYLNKLLEEAKPYTVSVYSYQFDMLSRCGALFSIDDSIYCLDKGYYNENTGLTVEKKSEFLDI